jgi:hypothetical protein
LRNNGNNINFDEECKIVAISSRSAYTFKINLAYYFGKDIPEHDEVYVKYENDNSVYDGRKVYTGELISNRIPVK